MINKIYLNERVKEQIRNAFKENSVIVLNNFFEDECYERMRSFLTAKGRKVKIPDRHSYEDLSGDESEEVYDFVRSVTGEKNLKLKTEVKRFGHRDYTLMHDSEAVGERHEFFIFVCDKWDADWGGMKVYLDSEGKSPFVFPPLGNTFCLIKKGKDMNSFVKYVNNHAGKNKMVIVEGHSNG